MLQIPKNFSVHKRNGSLQALDPGKISIAIERSSDEANQPMTSSDIEFVTQAACKDIFELFDEIVSYRYVRFAVYQALRDNGFDTVAEAYNRKQK